MGTIEKILKLIQMKNTQKSDSVTLYAEMKLDDGRVIATEDDQFMIGSKVFAISDSGDASALVAGTYTMENGNKLTLGDESEVLDLGEEKEAEDIESSKEDMAEEDESPAEKADWAESYEELKGRVEELEKAVYGKEEASEELSEDKKKELSEEKEKPIELSADLANEIITRMEELESKIVELSKEPATEGIEYNPEGSNFNSTVDLKKLSTKQRAAYYINNK
jgi:tetrahydromethanopterin S-methyltransferase subunit G